MASVSSLGVGSGIDLQGLVDGLVASERQLRLTGLATREAQATERISAYGLLKSATSLFNSSLQTLGNISTFQSRNSSSSNPDAFSVSANADAALGSFSVEVLDVGATQILTANSLVDVTNTAITSADVAIGGGTLTIRQGTQPSFAVEINSASSSLNDIATAINNAEQNTGVQASVINADAGPTLVISASESGTDNAITITVEDVDTNNTDALGLSQLTFDPLDLPGSNLTQDTEALNSQITVNGLAVTSTSGNVFSDVVTGVSITAIAETTAAGEINISQNTQQASDAINEFIENFNALSDSIADLGRAGSEDGQEAGVLVGDSVLRSLSSQLRRTIFTSVDTTQPVGVQSLSDIGINFDREGKLTLNSETFNALLESNFDDVARLVAADGEAIAQRQQFQSVEFDTVSSVVGEGDLQISSGEDSFTVSISAGAGNNTLSGIRNAINDAVDNVGVTASIVLVDDGAGGTNARLLLTAGGLGDDSAIAVSVTDSDANNTDLVGLSQLASENLIETVSTELDAPEGVIVRLQTVLAGFLGGSGEQGIIDTRTQGLNSDVDRIGDERLTQERRLDDFQQRLVRQFASLDLLVANLQSNGDFLLSQLNSAAQITNNRNSGN